MFYQSQCRLAKKRSLIFFNENDFMATRIFVFELKTYLETQTRCIIVVLFLWLRTLAFPCCHLRDGPDIQSPDRRIVQSVVGFGSRRTETGLACPLP